MQVKIFTAPSTSTVSLTGPFIVSQVKLAVGNYANASPSQYRA